MGFGPNPTPGGALRGGTVLKGGGPGHLRAAGQRASPPTRPAWCCAHLGFWDTDDGVLPAVAWPWLCGFSKCCPSMLGCSLENPQAQRQLCPHAQRGSPISGYPPPPPWPALTSPLRSQWFWAQGTFPGPAPWNWTLLWARYSVCRSTGAAWGSALPSLVLNVSCKTHRALADTLAGEEP